MRARSEEVATNVRASASELLRDVTGRLKSVPWYVAMEAEDRALLGEVAGRAIRGFAEWLVAEEPPPVERFVFRNVPRRMASIIGLDQTVELVHLMTSVGEEAAPALGGPQHEDWARREMMRFARDLALSLASIYARAAEWRGSVDARLEANLFNLLLSGASDDEVLAGGAALGWEPNSGATAVVGSLRAPQDNTAELIASRLRRNSLPALVGRLGDKVVLLVGAAEHCGQAAEVIGDLCRTPIVLGSPAPSLLQGHESIRVALMGSEASSMLPDCPGVIDAADLLPERALLGDPHAHRMLVDEIYEPLRTAGDHVTETLWSYLQCGGSMERAARLMHVHPNTIRYRLRRVVDETGYLPKVPRDAYVLRTALALGRHAIGVPAGTAADRRDPPPVPAPRQAPEQ